MTSADLAAFAIRAMMVALFLPFSAWYILADFRGARDHAASLGVGRGVGAVMMLGALAVEVVASLGVLTGVADRLAALTLAAFCLATAILYKRFWAVGDFAFRADSRAAGVFWDFLKNVSLAGGFLVLAFGATAPDIAEGWAAFQADPIGSTMPYGRTVP